MDYSLFPMACRRFNSFAATLFLILLCAQGAPVITQAPLSRLATAGQSLHAEVVATGDGTLNYQWKRNGLSIVGATQASLDLAAVTLADRGFYEVVVGDSSGTNARSVWRLDVGLAASRVIGWGPWGAVPSGATDIAALARNPFGYHSLALGTNGKVTAWGGYSPEAIAVPETLDQVVAVAGGQNHSLALRADGTIVQWGLKTSGTQLPENLDRVVAVAAGGDINAALRADGTVVAWGVQWGRRFVVREFLTGMVDVAVTKDAVIGLRSDGRVAVKQYGVESFPLPPDSLADVVAIAAGINHCLALCRNGSVVGWGVDYMGNTTIPASVSPALGIAASNLSSLVIKADGAVEVFGMDSAYQRRVPYLLNGAFALGYCMAVVPAQSPTTQVQAGPRSVVLGDAVVLTASVTGTLPLKFQWKRNGVALVDGGRISGATTDRLMLDPVDADDAGDYVLYVTNDFGETTSAVVTLQVRIPPRISQRPLSRLVQLGQPLEVSVPATAVGTVTYQWKLNGRVLAGVTGDTLRIPAVAITDEGRYEVLLTGAEASSFSVFYVSLSKVPVAAREVVCDDYRLNEQLRTMDTSKVVALAASGFFCAAVTEEGKVLGIGNTAYGQEAIPGDLDQVVAVAVGDYHVVALRADGSVRSWGGYAEWPGNPPAGLRRAVAVYAGGGRAFALKSDGTAVGWGDQKTPVEWNQIIDLAVSSTQMTALGSDGSVLSSRAQFPHLDMPADLKDVTLLKAGRASTIAMTRTGELYGWGEGWRAQSSRLQSLGSVKALTIGARRSFALGFDGLLVCLQGEATCGTRCSVLAAADADVLFTLSGSNTPSLLTQPGSVKRYAGDSVSIPAAFSCLPGTEISWTKNGGLHANKSAMLSIERLVVGDAGQYRASIGGSIATDPILLEVLPVPSFAGGSVPVKVVKVGSAAEFRVVPTGTAVASYSWKKNGQTLPGATNERLAFPVVQFSDAGTYSVELVTTDGLKLFRNHVLKVYSTNSTAVAINLGTSMPQPPSLDNVVEVAGGGDFGLLLRSDGLVTGWGSAGAAGSLKVPPGLQNVVGIAAGAMHALALKADGTVIIWGDNTYGQLAIPAGLSDVVAVSACGSRSIALRADGTVLTWGMGQGGSISTPAALRRIIAVACNGTGYLALKADGSTFRWGPDTAGDLDVESSLRNAVAIAMGEDSNYLLRLDGSAYGWPLLSSMAGLMPTDLGPVRILSSAPYVGMALGVDGRLRFWGNLSGQPNLPERLPAAVQLVGSIGQGLAVLSEAAAAPSIVSQPTQVSVLPGEEAVLSVVVAGTPPLRFEWFKNGENYWWSKGLTGTNTAALHLPNAMSVDVASYTLKISNREGAVTSAPINLVLKAGSITPSAVPTVGGSVTLTAALEGVTGYQWRLNGSALVGATNAALTLSELSRADNGVYDVVATTPGGVVVVGAYPMNVAPVRLPSQYQLSSTYAPILEREGRGAIRAQVTLPDGKILIGGDFTHLAGVRIAYLARLHADGSLDTGFVPPKMNGPVHALMLDPGGGVFVGGAFSHVAGRPMGGVCRLGADLALDTAFDVGVGFAGTVYTLGRQPSGRILAGGSFASFRSENVHGLVRLMQNGDRDGSLAQAFDFEVRILLVDTYGNFVVAGGAPVYNYNPTGGIIRRCNADGTTAADWSSNVTLDYVSAIAGTQDGKWLVGTKSSSMSSTKVVRLLAGGQQDVSFVFDPELHETCSEVSLLVGLPGGKILLGGKGIPLCRLNGTGSLDRTFTPLAEGGQLTAVPQVLQSGDIRFYGLFAPAAGAVNTLGWVTLPAAANAFLQGPALAVRGEAELFGLRPGPDRTLYVHGDFTHVNDARRAGLVRLTRDGAVDVRFNASLVPEPSELVGPVFQGDGRIIVYSDGLVRRLLPSGAVDGTYPAIPYAVEKMALASDGGLLVAGRDPASAPGATKALRKWTPSGARDASFDVSYRGVLDTLVPMAGGRIILNRGLTHVNGEAVPADSYHRLMPNGVRDVRFVLQVDALTRVLPETYEAIYLLVAGVQLRRNFYDGNQDLYVDGVSSLCLSPDGRLLLGRMSGLLTANGLNGYPVLSRLSATGALDTSFTALDMDSWRAQIRQIVLEDDGSLVLRGRSMALDGENRGGLLRLEESVAVKIVTNPESVVGSLGGEAVFSVVATGSGVLGYQWYRNGQALPGATNATLSLAQLKPENVGSYTVKVVNRSSAATSSPVALSGNRPSPIILSQPQSREVVSGATASFSVLAQPGATGGTLAYQWRRQGFPIAGATGATLVLSNVRRFDASYYDVIVSDGLTSVRSGNARLSVDPSALPNVLAIDAGFRAQVEVWGGEIAAIHPAPDGKFLVTGTFTRIGGLPRPGLARIDAQLAVDPAFVPDQELIDPTVFAVTADGKVIVGTRKANQAASVTGYFLLRLNADGTRDTSFNPSNDIGNVTRVSQQSDGSLVAAIGYPLGSRRSLYKIATDGSYDPAFMPLFQSNGDGTIQPAAVSVVESLPDGTIVCFGYYTLLNGNPVPAWVRLRQDGSRVEAFNANLKNGATSVRQIIQKRDGRLLFVGPELNLNSLGSRVVCLMPDGSADGAFLPDSEVRSAFKLFQQPDGSFKLFTQEGGMARVGRMTEDGRMEDLVEYGACPVWLKDAGIAASGELFLGGYIVSGSESSKLAMGNTLWRIGAAGTNTAKVATEKPSGVSCLASGPAGTIYLGGEFTRVNGQLRRHLVRIHADGVTDPSFDCVESLDGTVTNLLVQPDGRVIVSGAFTHYGATSVPSMIRLSASGAHDTSFVSAKPNGSPLLQLGERKVLVSGFGRLFNDGSRDEAAPQDLQVLHAVERMDRSCWLYYSDSTTPGYPLRLGVLAEEGSFQKGNNIGQYGGVRSLLDRHDGSLLLGSSTYATIDGQPSLGIAPVVEHYMADLKRDGTYVGTGYPLPQTYISSADGPYLFDLGAGYTLVSSYLGTYRLNRNGVLDSAFIFPAVTKWYTGAPYERPDGFKNLLVLDDGRLLLADRGFWVGNRVIQGLVMLGAANAPSITPLPTSAFAAIGKSWSLTATVQGSAEGLSYQWYRNGVAIAGATGNTLTLAAPTIADSGSYTLRVTNAVGTATSAGTELTVDVERVPPAFSQVPENQWVLAGTGVSFTVRTTGTEPMTYAWEKDGVKLATGGRLSGCDTATLSISATQLSDGGLYRVKVTNEAGAATSPAARLSVVPAGVAGAHSCPGWAPGDTATVTVAITHNGDVSALSVSALVPEGWTYAGGSGEPVSKPALGDGGALVWTFASVPASPVTFSYTLAVPTAQTGIKSVATIVSMTLTGGDASFLLKPDPLVLRSLRHHSADTDNDWRISSAELLRVLELYATRKDAARTGAYAVREPSSDGFAPDPLRAPADAPSLTRYHAADSDRNGRLSLQELARLIQLHNTRTGANRTGAYHLKRAEDAAHEDGFSPGP